MGFQKFNKSEGHTPSEPGKISKLLKRFGKTSAADLTDEERRQIDGENQPNND